MENQPDNFKKLYTEGVVGPFVGETKKKEEREETWRKAKDKKSAKFDPTKTIQGEIKFD